MVADFTRKERKVVEAAWSALEYCADTAKSNGTANELADMLKYETGSKTAGRPRHWAKMLMIDAYCEGRSGDTGQRRVWLYTCLHISRGIRYAYLLGCADEFRDEPQNLVQLMPKCLEAVQTYNRVCERRAAA